MRKHRIAFLVILFLISTLTSYPQPIPVSEDLLQILHPLPELK